MEFMWLITKPGSKFLISKQSQAEAEVPAYSFEETLWQPWTDHKGTWVEVVAVRES